MSSYLAVLVEAYEDWRGVRIRADSTARLRQPAIDPDTSLRGGTWQTGHGTSRTPRGYVATHLHETPDLTYASRAISVVLQNNRPE